MIIQILVTQGQAVYPLRYQFRYRMFDGFRISLVFKAPRESREDSGPLFGLSQKKTSGIRCDVSTIDFTNNFLSVMAYFLLGSDELINAVPDKNIHLWPTLIGFVLFTALFFTYIYYLRKNYSRIISN